MLAWLPAFLLLFLGGYSSRNSAPEPGFTRLKQALSVLRPGSAKPNIESNSGPTANSCLHLPMGPLPCIQGVGTRAGGRVTSGVPGRGTHDNYGAWGPGPGGGRCSAWDAQSGALAALWGLGSRAGRGGREAPEVPRAGFLPRLPSLCLWGPRSTCRVCEPRRGWGRIWGAQGGVLTVSVGPLRALRGWGPRQAGQGGVLRAQCGALTVPAVAKDLGKGRAASGVTRAGLSP